jgi:hypothetical protein
MTEPWSPAVMYRSAVSRHCGPWWCQLIHHELGRDELVLDLVALETCPADPIGCPRDTPFTLRTARSNIDPAMVDQGAAWASGADIVSITCGTTEAGEAWLCLSNCGRLLVLLH